MFKDALEDHSKSCQKAGICDICRLDPSLVDSWSEQHRYLQSITFPAFLSRGHFRILKNNTWRTVRPTDGYSLLLTISSYTIPPFYILFRYGRLDRIYEGKTLRTILSEFGWRQNQFPGTYPTKPRANEPTDQQPNHLSRHTSSYRYPKTHLKRETKQIAIPLKPPHLFSRSRHTAERWKGQTRRLAYSPKPTVRTHFQGDGTPCQKTKNNPGLSLPCLV